MKGADPIYQIDLRSDPPCSMAPLPGGFTPRWQPACMTTDIGPATALSSYRGKNC